MNANRITGPIALALLAAPSLATTLVSQLPPVGGAVLRSSQLWVDPHGDNDLDSDAICWEDFVLSAPATLTHLEWWGNGACELGFDIDFWRQDPGTIAYQPLAVFDVWGPDPSPVQPEARFAVTPADYTVTAMADGLFHYVLELPEPVSLGANDAANPRWFLGIIGRTHQPFVTWNWARGNGGSTRTYQWVRGLHGFRVLPEGRAMTIRGTVAAVCPGDTNGDNVVDFADLNQVISQFNTSDSGLTGDVNDDGSVDFGDLNMVLSGFNVPCP